MNKGLDMASLCLVKFSKGKAKAIIYLRERFSRKKRSPDFFYQGVEDLKKELSNKELLLAETSYDLAPPEQEKILEKTIKFKHLLKKRKVSNYSSLINKNIQFYTHHLCHAEVAAHMSPYKKAIIVVADGGGSIASAFTKDSPEASFAKEMLYSNQVTEKLSVYLFEKNSLICVQKNWQPRPLTRKNFWSNENSWGLMFENISEYIFGNTHEAGKVMGLAMFSEGRQIKKYSDLKKIALEKYRFKGYGKKEWEASPHKNLYQEIAATMQNLYINELSSFISNLHENYPGFENLILTGGCALNCAANQELLENSDFSSIYVPPFPGDECVSFGAALLRAREAGINKTYLPLSWNRQSSFLGPLQKKLSLSQIKKYFLEYKIEHPDNLSLEVAKLLDANELVAVFRGQSETGPRALGHRSILGNPSNPLIKSYLNEQVKGRESFRPYGGTVLDQYKSQYFDVDQNFESPFMSFAPKIRKKYLKKLIGISHVDETSRIQTLRRTQDPFFYDLIKHFGKKSGIYCLLNTSLNIMGEPIVETPKDAARLFKSSPLKYLVLNDYLICKQ